MYISAIGSITNKYISNFNFLSASNLNNNRINNSIASDVFVSNNVSFGKRITKKDLSDALITTGIVGAPFLLSLTFAAALASHSNPEDIFLSDGTYMFNTNDLSINSDRIHADVDDGIFKIDGTGINLDPKTRNFDYVDVKHGIYKNFDGSVDIDLLNNKYIDTTNGICIDPVSKVSTIVTDGVEQHVPLVNFGTSMNPADHWVPAPNPPASMDEIRDALQNSDVYHCGTSNGGHFFIEQKDMDVLAQVINNPDYVFTTPAEEYQFERLVNFLNHEGILENRYRAIDTIQDIISKNEGILDKIKHFFNGIPSVDNSTKYDLFGREIIPIGHGTDMTLTTLPENTESIKVFFEFLNHGHNVADAANHVNSTLFNNFLDTHSISFKAVSSALDGFVNNAVTHHDNLNLADATASCPVDIDLDAIDSILKQLKSCGEVVITPNSYEAINFALFQEHLLNTGDILEPILNWDVLLDPETIISSIDSLCSGGFDIDVDQVLDFLGSILGL